MLLYAKLPVLGVLAKNIVFPDAGHYMYRMMIVEVLYSKLHRATITDADLHYEGSVMIDRHLMDLAGLQAHEKVDLYNITRGTRLSTYVIEGEAHSGVIQTNGAAAHLMQKDDLVIIAHYAQMPKQDVATWRPKIVLLDEHNKPKNLDSLLSVA